MARGTSLVEDLAPARLGIWRVSERVDPFDGVRGRGPFWIRLVLRSPPGRARQADQPDHDGDPPYERAARDNADHRVLPIGSS